MNATIKSIIRGQDASTVHVSAVLADGQNTPVELDIPAANATTVGVTAAINAWIARDAATKQAPITIPANTVIDLAAAPVVPPKTADQLLMEDYRRWQRWTAAVPAIIAANDIDYVALQNDLKSKAAQLKVIL